MPVDSLNEFNRPRSTAEVLKAGGLSGVGRGWILLLNLVPLLHVLLLAVVVLRTSWSIGGRTLAVLTLLFLLPPVVCRLIWICKKLPEGRWSVGSREFVAWWASFQLQIVFCRLPVLEECLRLVPGLYSQWLRLWGSRIGRYTYWSAGTIITDRSFLEIGDDVVLGAGVRLNAHVISNDQRGNLELSLGTIKIGDRALIGGYSLLTAGSVVPADEKTRACLLSPPFTQWKSGRRVAGKESDE